MEMVPRYLRAFGPATRADFERWAGMLPPLARPAWAECQPEMAEVQVEGKKLWALADDAAAIRETEPSEEIRLVPNFDSYLLGHTDRSAMVAQEHSASRGGDVGRVPGEAGGGATLPRELGALEGPYRDARRLPLVTQGFRPLAQRTTSFSKVVARLSLTGSLALSV